MSGRENRFWIPGIFTNFGDVFVPKLFKSIFYTFLWLKLNLIEHDRPCGCGRNRHVLVTLF